MDLASSDEVRKHSLRIGSRINSRGDFHLAAFEYNRKDGKDFVSYLGKCIICEKCGVLMLS